MAYFQQNEQRPLRQDETRCFDTSGFAASEEEAVAAEEETGNTQCFYTGDVQPQTDEIEEDYDDGLDAPDEEEYRESDLSFYEKLQNWRQGSGSRAAIGFSNLFLSVLGVAVILVALALLISMVDFVVTDIGNSFTLLKTQF